MLVARLRAAGCVVVGKTNAPEFATSADTSNLVFGSTRNPYDVDRVAGGSSGGAAVAVASGMVPLATASDGGGSIRIPASACGLPGFKPSLGRVPDGGPHPVDWPLVTTRGVITRTVADLIATLDVIVGPEPSDLRSLPAPCEPFSVGVGRTPLPRRIAWSPQLGYDWTEPSILAACTAAVERLAAEGVEVVEIDRVFDSEPYDAWGPLIAAYVQRSVGELDRSLLTEEVRAGHRGRRPADGPGPAGRRGHLPPAEPGADQGVRDLRPAAHPDPAPRPAAVRARPCPGSGPPGCST